MQVHIYIYECVQACFIQLAKYSLVYFLSLCSHTPFFIFLFQSISVLLVYVRVCNLSALSPAVLSEIAEVIS